MFLLKFFIHGSINLLAVTLHKNSHNSEQISQPRSPDCITQSIKLIETKAVGLACCTPSAIFNCLIPKSLFSSLSCPVSVSTPLLPSLCVSPYISFFGYVYPSMLRNYCFHWCHCVTSCQRFFGSFYLFG